MKILIAIRMLVLAAAGAWLATAPVQAQLWPPRLPVGRPGPQPPAPVPVSPAALQADLVAKSGSDTVYFPPRGYTLDANAIATLSAQAQWLLANPFTSIRLEGHGDQRDTNDYALAIGDRRANAVRDFLLLQGIAPHRITVVSWGKERPGTVRIGTALVAAGPRVVTRVQ